MKVNIEKFCKVCGCELERGEIEICRECQTEKTTNKTIHQIEETFKVPFPKFSFNF